MRPAKRNRRTSRRDRSRPSRRGTTALEMALVLIVLMPLVLGMLDFGLAVFRYHVVAETARQIARRAIVHGTMADRLGTWGPENHVGTGADSYLVTGVGEEPVKELLKVLEPSKVTIEAEWIDGNDFEDLVHITTSVPYQPIMPFLNPMTLRGESTMPIAH